MAVATKAKPKAARTKAAPKAKPAAKEKAPKPIVALEVGAFATFTGYKAEVSKDEQVFKDGDLVYIIEVIEDEEQGLMYAAIPPEQIPAFQDDGEDAVQGGAVAPQELAALKSTALDKAREKFVPVTLLGKLEDMFAEHDGSAIEVARELNDTIQAQYFWLGGALARVLQDGSYLDENGGDYTGETAFEDFCRAEFDFGASKGRQLARLYATFSKLPEFDVDQLASYSWSLIAKAERFVTADNVDEVLEVVGNSTQRNVDDNLKSKFSSESNVTASGKAATRSGPNIVKKALSFRMEESSAETVELALKQCMSESGIESPELALERICLEWAQDHVSGDAAKKRIEAKQRKAEAARNKAAKPADAGKPAAKKPATARAPKGTAAGRKKAA